MDKFTIFHGKTQDFDGPFSIVSCWTSREYQFQDSPWTQDDPISLNFRGTWYPREVQLGGSCVINRIEPTKLRAQRTNNCLLHQAEPFLVKSSRWGHKKYCKECVRTDFVHIYPTLQKCHWLIFTADPTPKTQGEFQADVPLPSCQRTWTRQPGVNERELQLYQRSKRNINRPTFFAM